MFFFIYYINKNKDIKQFAQYKINYSEYEREGVSLEKLYNKLTDNFGNPPYSLDEFKEYATSKDFLGNLYDDTARRKKMKVSRKQFIDMYSHAKDAIKNNVNIYIVNGERYDIPISKMQNFESLYPNARIVIYDGEGEKYALPISIRSKFQKYYAKWSYHEPEPKSKSDTSGNSSTNLNIKNKYVETFILSWVFPVSILLVISFISFFIARRYMEKNKAKTLFAICLFISFALGLYIQNNRFEVKNYSNFCYILYDKITAKTYCFVHDINKYTIN